MPSVMKEKTKAIEQAIEQAYKSAGFSVERTGNGTVFERELPESVRSVTRALINGHGKAAKRKAMRRERKSVP